MMELIQLKNITKAYRRQSPDAPALEDINLTIHRGELIAIMGPSGSGKSTLLNILGFMDHPTEGDYLFDAQPLQRISSRHVHRTRNQMVGFVFQHFALLKDYTVQDNVILPLTFRKGKHKDRVAKATHYLEKVGLASHRLKKANELSGGQQQRVAIARALVGEPELILADEPTGNLDRRTGEEIMDLLQQLHHEGRTIIIVTHDDEVAKRCDRIIRLVDGKVLTDQNNYQHQV